MIPSSRGWDYEIATKLFYWVKKEDGYYEPLNSSGALPPGPKNVPFYDSDMGEAISIPWEMWSRGFAFLLLKDGKGWTAKFKKGERVFAHTSDGPSHSVVIAALEALNYFSSQA